MQSDEDLEVRQRMELYVERAQDSDPRLRIFALRSMRQEIRSAANSITSVSKPLKFLRPHYGTLEAYFTTMRESESKRYMADILSVLAFTMPVVGRRESLKYRLLGSEGDIISWGHEYVRNLSREIALECDERREVGLLAKLNVPLKSAFTRAFWENRKAQIGDLMELVKQIVPFYMKHNAEPEAVDLLTEVDELYYLNAHLDKTNFKRTCLYLTSLARYLPERDDILNQVCWIYLQHEAYPSALQIALSLDDLEHVSRAFNFCDDVLQKKQCCYILARHGITFVLDECMVPNEDDRLMLQDIIYNSMLSEGYLTLARDIEVMEPKSPEDIYKESKCSTPKKGTGKATCKPICILMDSNLKLDNADDSAIVDKEMHQYLVEKLIYLSHTRSNIAFAISLVSQSREVHLQVIQNFVVPTGTSGRGILHKRNINAFLETYTDVDYTSSVIDQRSLLDIVPFLEEI
ncbi:26S proteasome non-ATPase regulatory subunit 2-like A, partial [Mucuna pruriens]